MNNCNMEAVMNLRIPLLFVLYVFYSIIYYLTGFICYLVFGVLRLCYKLIAKFRKKDKK